MHLFVIHLLRVYVVCVFVVRVLCVREQGELAHACEDQRLTLRETSSVALCII